ncbi:hypothetical protein B0J14DRAFT_98354 [Halenospora varia]|nr:hypothetical protein B0J14DRAFT_98354 [Halenospora varia]
MSLVEGCQFLLPQLASPALTLLSIGSSLSEVWVLLSCFSLPTNPNIPLLEPRNPPPPNTFPERVPGYDTG